MGVVGRAHLGEEVEDVDTGLAGEAGHLREFVQVFLEQHGVDVHEGTLLARFFAEPRDVADAFDAAAVGAALCADDVVHFLGAVDGDADEVEAFAAEAFRREVDAELRLLFVEHDGVRDKVDAAVVARALQQSREIFPYPHLAAREGHEAHGAGLIDDVEPLFRAELAVALFLDGHVLEEIDVLAHLAAEIAAAGDFEEIVPRREGRAVARKVIGHGIVHARHKLIEPRDRALRRRAFVIHTHLKILRVFVQPLMVLEIRKNWKQSVLCAQ